jgi:hypothetical protein
MVYGAAMLVRIRPVALARLAAAAVLVATGLYGLAFVNLYDQPHPWTAASRWLYESARPGATILGETWDDHLPDVVEIDGRTYRPARFNLGELDWMNGTGKDDDAGKLAQNLGRLARADYVVLATNRNYGVIPRLPERFPISSQYHQLLFDGRLGYRLAYAGLRAPGLFGYSFIPDPFRWPGLEPPPQLAAYFRDSPAVLLGRADESFTVYDQPLVLIFRNSGRMSADEMLERFEVAGP